MHLLVKLNGIGGGREPPDGGRRLRNVMTWFTQRRTRRGRDNCSARRHVRKAKVGNAKAFLIHPLQLSPSSFQVVQIKCQVRLIPIRRTLLSATKVCVRRNAVRV
jgi:hypothetical protein